MACFIGVMRNATWLLTKVKLGPARRHDLAEGQGALLGFRV